ncbi:hypothetical protein C1646_753730 [Rhizophagus diaphanus]|nr:hypothetical protein C1646_753730 [Rhizophagus diaphanus] [Rhizophagus sp. MUCL 43196]
MLSRPRLGVNTWELFHPETYPEETSTRKSHNDLSGELDILIRNLEPETKERIATNSGRGKNRHLLRPTVNLGIIVATLKDTQLRKLYDSIPVLNRIIKEVGGVQVHKDFAVVFAETAHALSRILSTHTFSESEISLIRVHIALVNNFHIYVLCFELQSGCIGADIENVLNLIVYLRQIDCKDGLLPSEAENPEYRSTEDKRNDYYGNYPVLLEEENVNQQVIDLFLTGSSSMKISNLLN